MIEISNLNFSYIKNFAVFNDLTLSIEKDVKQTILGVRGSGKSTLSKIFSKEIKKYGGNIVIDGINIKDKSIKVLNFCCISHDYLLSQNKTVRENCEYGLVLRKTPKDEIKNLVDIALKKCDITYIADKIVKDITPCQCFMTALARGIARNPNLLILDDVFLKQKVEDRITYLNQVINIIKSIDCYFIFLTEDVEIAKILDFKTAIINYGKISFNDDFSKSNLYNE